MKKKLPVIFIILLLSLGLALLIYPAISDLVSKWTSSATVNRYQQAVEDMDVSARQDMLTAASEYNRGLSGTIIKDAFSSDDEESVYQNKEYYSLLNLNGVMAYVEIPSINVYLPIYHGTGQETLKKGVGHLEGSALPVGGVGTHAVISDVYKRQEHHNQQDKEGSSQLHRKYGHASPPNPLLLYAGAQSHPVIRCV